MPSGALAYQQPSSNATQQTKVHSHEVQSSQHICAPPLPEIIEILIFAAGEQFNLFLCMIDEAKASRADSAC